MSGFRLYTVRVRAGLEPGFEVGVWAMVATGQSATPHFVDSEDAALDAMARAGGYPSYRAWQAEHPAESGWSVAVDAGEPDNQEEPA
jgi:hypothetical protein